MTEKRLYRSCNNRIFAGICGGIGEYFNIDPVLVRLLFVLGAIPGLASVFVYFVAWLLIPEDPAYLKTHKQTTEPFEEDIKQRFENSTKSEVNDSKGHHAHGEGRLIFGSIVIFIGLSILVNNLVGWNIWSHFWPIILIIAGLVLIFRNRRKV